MTGIVDDQTLDLPCPKCGKKTKKTVRWVKANKQFTCSCGTAITLDADQFRAEIAKLEKAFAKLEGMFKQR